MLNSLGYFPNVFFLVLAGAGLAVPVLLWNIKVAPRWNLIDRPKARGLTDEHVPIVGFGLSVLTLSILGAATYWYSMSPWFFITAAVMGLLGHFDDRNPLPPLDKFFFQVLSALTVLFLDPVIYSSLTSQFGGWGGFWGAFFILGLVNAINFIDGIDGLAGIIIMVGAVGFLGLSVWTPELEPRVIVAATIAGMMIPFLHVNIVRRRGFLGNMGSYFFSYVLAVLHLTLPTENPGVVSRLSVSALCFLIPIADTCTVVSLRMLTGRSPFLADKSHLHHRMLQTSLKLRYVLLTFAAIEVVGLVSALAIHWNMGARSSTLVPAIVCAGFVLITALLILVIERSSRSRLAAYFERLDTGQSVFFLRYLLGDTQGAPLSLVRKRRVEARVGAELRVTDFCYIDDNEYFTVTVKTLAEPLRSIAGRVEKILQNEQVVIRQGPELGEYGMRPHEEVRHLSLTPKEARK